MAIIQIDRSNIDSEHICCAIGNDKLNKAHAETKKSWMKDRFDQGLVFKRLNERGKVFIEYIPIENALKPVLGKNYMMINCLWVSGKFKGKGYSTELLNECINDSKSQKMDGIAIITSTRVKPFLTDKRFFVKKGFQTVDFVHPDYELLLLKFNDKAKNPTFSDSVRKGECTNKSGFTFIFSNQCPFMEKYVELLSSVAAGKGISYRAIKIESSADAQNFAGPFGTFALYFDGKYLTHELLSESKFEKLINSL